MAFRLDFEFSKSVFLHHLQIQLGAGRSGPPLFHPHQLLLTLCSPMPTVSHCQTCSLTQAEQVHGGGVGEAAHPLSCSSATSDNGRPLTCRKSFRQAWLEPLQVHQSVHTTAPHNQWRLCGLPTTQHGNKQLGAGQLVPTPI